MRKVWRELLRVTWRQRLSSCQTLFSPSLLCGWNEDAVKVCCLLIPQLDDSQ